MARSRGRVRRRTLTVGLLGALLFTASVFVFESFASAATGQNGSQQTFQNVKCTAHVGSSTVTQSETISVWITAPDSVDQGETFSIGIPSMAADLPSSSQGLTINSYKNLITKYVVNGGGVVVGGSGTTDGPAMINGNPTPQNTDTNSPNVGPDIPGPLPPGHLVPANGAAQITAPNSDATITISAVEVDTTANVQSFGDVPVTCPVPQNTLTSTTVGAGGPTSTSTSSSSTSTTFKPTTTTTVGSGGGSGDTVACTISGTTTFKPPITAAGGIAAKGYTEHVKVVGTMTGCSGGPNGLRAPVKNGTFTATGIRKIPAGAQQPTCASFESSNAFLALRWSAKLKNGTKLVASVKGPATLGPIVAGDPTTFDIHGSVTNRGAFNGKPLTINAITNTNDTGLAATCRSSGGLASLRFVNPSAFSLGPPPPPPTTTTTSTSTSTSTLSSTSTTEATTTTTMNPVPPEVGQAIITACTTLAGALAPAGVDITPITIGCQAFANGQGSFLLQTFLDSPQLGCLLLAGAPVANNPTVAAGCVTFATAIAPYSAIIASLIPTGFF